MKSPGSPFVVLLLILLVLVVCVSGSMYAQRSWSRRQPDPQTPDAPSVEVPIQPLPDQPRPPSSYAPAWPVVVTDKRQQNGATVIQSILDLSAKHINSVLAAIERQQDKSRLSANEQVQYALCKKQRPDAVTLLDAIKVGGDWSLWTYLATGFAGDHAFLAALATNAGPGKKIQKLDRLFVALMLTDQNEEHLNRQTFADLPVTKHDALHAYHTELLSALRQTSTVHRGTFDLQHLLRIFQLHSLRTRFGRHYSSLFHEYRDRIHHVYICLCLQTFLSKYYSRYMLLAAQTLTYIMNDNPLLLGVDKNNGFLVRFKAIVESLWRTVHVMQSLFVYFVDLRLYLSTDDASPLSVVELASTQPSDTLAQHYTEFDTVVGRLELPTATYGALFTFNEPVAPLPSYTNTLDRHVGRLYAEEQPILRFRRLAHRKITGKMGNINYHTLSFIHNAPLFGSVDTAVQGDKCLFGLVRGVASVSSMSGALMQHLQFRAQRQRCRFDHNSGEVWLATVALSLVNPHVQVMERQKLAELINHMATETKLQLMEVCRLLQFCWHTYSVALSNLKYRSTKTAMQEQGSRSLVWYDSKELPLQLPNAADAAMAHVHRAWYEEFVAPYLMAGHSGFEDAASATYYEEQLWAQMDLQSLTLFKLIQERLPSMMARRLAAALLVGLLAYTPRDFSSMADQFDRLSAITAELSQFNNAILRAPMPLPQKPWRTDDRVRFTLVLWERNLFGLCNETEDELAAEVLLHNKRLDQTLHPTRAPVRVLSQRQEGVAPYTDLRWDPLDTLTAPSFRHNDRPTHVSVWIKDVKNPAAKPEHNQLTLAIAAVDEGSVKIYSLLWDRIQYLVACVETRNGPHHQNLWIVSVPEPSTKQRTRMQLDSFSSFHLEPVDGNLKRHPETCDVPYINAGVPQQGFIYNLMLDKSTHEETPPHLVEFDDV